MAETRVQSRPPQEGSTLEEEIAAAIALILAGQVVPEVGVVAAIAALLTLLPGIPEADDTEGTEGSVSRSVARLVVRDTPATSRRSGAEVRTSVSNLSYRAHYAIEAVKRVAERVRSGESIAEAFQGERRFYTQHLEANRRRVSAARMNDAAAERWGPVLSWNDTGRAKTHRPAHLAASGANFDLRSPPAATGFKLPGEEPNCDCVAGPPIQGARLLR